ncbi:MAG: hypothetical protein WH035_02515 [Spirochaetota bacterium]
MEIIGNVITGDGSCPAGAEELGQSEHSQWYKTEYNKLYKKYYYRIKRIVITLTLAGDGVIILSVAGVEIPEALLAAALVAGATGDLLELTDALTNLILSFVDESISITDTLISSIATCIAEYLMNH